jgi:uncharacterized membrane protein
MGRPHQDQTTGVHGGVTEEGKKRPRFAEVDVLRGLVMIVMALDHVHYYFSDPLLEPTDLQHTTSWQFLTRWSTHFCAPVFVFLAGTAAFLRASRGTSRGNLAGFLLIRGLWLILLELTVVRWSWTFTPDLNHSEGQVIWAIGFSMMVLAGLIYLPRWAITAFGIGLIASHNLLDGLAANDFGAMSWLFLLLHGQGNIDILPGVSFYVYYPLIPWIGVMAIGYTFGSEIVQPEPVRRRRLLCLGVFLILTFLALRGLNVYGNPTRWQEQSTVWFTILSFFNGEKYPPSLLFLLMTLGPAIALLSVPADWWGWWGRICIVFGKVPLFYYLLHIPLIHLLALGFAEVYYGRVSFLIDTSWLVVPTTCPPGYGYSLPVVYFVWVGVVLALYPVCLWFGRLKQLKHWWWLSYL